MKPGGGRRRGRENGTIGVAVAGRGHQQGIISGQKKKGGGGTRGERPGVKKKRTEKGGAELDKSEVQHFWAWAWKNLRQRGTEGRGGRGSRRKLGKKGKDQGQVS